MCSYKYFLFFDTEIFQVEFIFFVFNIGSGSKGVRSREGQFPPGFKKVLGFGGLFEILGGLLRVFGPYGRV